MANAVTRFPVPLAFKKVLKDELSGVLEVTHKDFEKKLFFIDGSLEFAATTLEKERIGEILAAEGKIDRSQLETALQVRENVPTKTGEILAKMFDLSMGDIFNALKTQVTRIALSLFTLQEGEWRFSIQKNPELPNRHKFGVKVSSIIHDGIKQMEDFSYFKKRFFFRAPVTLHLPDSIAKILSPVETGFFDELSECANTSVKKIFSSGKRSENIFWQQLTRLYLLNVVDFVEFTVDAEEENRKIAELNELHHKLYAENLDQYQLLGVSKDADVEKIDKQFEQFSERYNPANLDAAPDSTTVMRAEDVFAHVRQAYKAARQEAEERKKDAPLTLDQAMSAQPPPGLDKPVNEVKEEEAPAAEEEEKEYVNPVKQAREFFNTANALHNRKQYREAVQLLELAVQKDPSKANYYLLLGLCQSKMPTTKKQAEKNLKKAAAMEPWNADPVFALGQLYRSVNLVQKAKEYYERALEINMEHTLAGRAIQDVNQLVGGKKSLFSMFGKKK